MKTLKDFFVGKTNELIKNGGIHSKILEGDLDYFIILGIMEQDVEISVDDKIYEISSGHLVFISPGKRIKIKQADKTPITMIAFTSDFFGKSATDTLLLHSELFFDCRFETQILASVRTPVEFNRLIIEKLTSCEKRDYELYKLVAHNCVETLLLDGFLALNMDAPEQRDLKDLTALQLVNYFKVLIYKHYKKEINVTFYAESLYVTARNLSDSCMKILGKTAKDTIMDTITEEAIRYIRNTDLTISEIAFEMGFSDESNFRRFLKKHTGKKPMEYRELVG